MKLKQLQKYEFFKNKKIKSLNLISNQGFCNVNYIIKTQKDKYLLRLFKNSNYYDLDRNTEFKVQKKAYKKNLASKPHLIDLENNLMISDFSKGHHKKTLNKKEIKKLAIKIRKIHQIKINIKKYDIKKDLKYYDKLKDKRAKKLASSIKKEYKVLKKYKKELVLCHNDLNPQNILFSKNEIKFIDWEYTFINDRFFDLATICIEFNLNKREEELLLKTYLKKIKKYHKKKITSYKIICKSISKLWFLNLK